MNTAAGSPSRRARVSSSAVVLRTEPSTWSTSTSTCAIGVTPLPVRAESWTSDQLRAGQVRDQPAAAVARVGDDLAGLPRRAGGDLLDHRPGGGGADLVGGDVQVGQRPGLDRLLLRGHDP